jgi:hypothetical protein
MSDSPSVETPAPTQLSDRDLDDVAGGLLPAVAPAPVAVSSQPVLPAVQRNLIGLL